MGDRKFRCTFQGCTKTFNRRDYLERHAANHLQIKPYVCHQCERQFSRRDLYENHLTTRFHSRRTRENAGPPASLSLQQDLSDQSQIQAPLQPPLQPPLQTPFQGPSMGADEVYFNGQPSIDFELNSTSSNSELPNSLLAPSIRSDFDTNSFYGVIPGLDSERWDYYRPLKRLPGLNDYGDRSSTPKRRASPLGSNFSLSEGGDSVVSSEGSGGANSNDTVETGTTNATSVDSDKPSSTSRQAQSQQHQHHQPKTQQGQQQQQQQQQQQLTDLHHSPTQRAPHGSTPAAAPAAAYKMWLIDRFNDSSDQGFRALREPEGPSNEYDKKFEWFFDDSATKDRSGYDYSRVCHDLSRTCKERSLRYQAVNWPSRAPPKEMPRADEERAQLLVQIIASGSADVIKSGRDVDHYLEVAWTKAHVVSGIVHRPTFHPNTTHPALLAVLVILGMALSSNEPVKAVARAAAPNVSLFVYESLQQPEGPMSTRFSAAYIGHFQAFCLLFKYEPLIIGPDLYASSLIRASSCQRSADRFISSLIAAVPHLGLTPDSEQYISQSCRKPVWATITREGYNMHHGVDKGAQWREWAAYEMCKRTVHFTIYYDSVIRKCEATHSGALISLFSLDIHSPAPEGAWHARDPDEFFYTVGPSDVLTEVPFLGLIKSVLVPPYSTNLGSKPFSQDDGGSSQGCVSLFTFRMLAHGLMNITSRVTGVFGQGEELMKAVLGRLRPEEKAVQVMPYFDHNIQSRLYHGLDVWFQQFEKSFGPITDRLYNISDAVGLRITSDTIDDFRSGHEDAKSNGIPQYALYLVVYHYSSFIVVHEDLPVVLQVATNLTKWLKQDVNFDQKKLLEYLYMPLYVQWIESDEAKAIVTTSSLLLAWVDAATGQVETKSWNQLFVSAVIYTSVMVIWLRDLVSFYNANNRSLANYSAGTVGMQNYDFIGQALQYLEYVRDHPDGHHHRPSAQHPVLSVLLMGACILYNRPHTHELYERLERLICTLDTSLNPERVRLVLEGAPEMFKGRHEQTT